MGAMPMLADYFKQSKMYYKKNIENPVVLPYEKIKELRERPVLDKVEMLNLKKKSGISLWYLLTNEGDPYLKRGHLNAYDMSNSKSIKS